MTVDLIEGDSREILKEFADNSLDSCVADPPYALTSVVKRFGKQGAAPARTPPGGTGAYARASAGFMGQKWDTGDTAFDPAFWAEVLRVLKPGAHLIAFGGTRTYHRLACAIEDAGFEIRDQIGWAYGSGFPKSHNQKGDWEGWGTALKPAWEPICLARKPLGEKTVAANLAKWGTGALNIDASRVGLSEGDDPRLGGAGAWTTTQKQSGDTVSLPRGTVASSPLGRWPANVIHDGSDEVVEAFPDAKGQQGDLKGHARNRGSLGVLGDTGLAKDHLKRADTSSSAARFFYCAKTSKADREEGLEAAPDRVLAMSNQAKAELARGNMSEGKNLGVNNAKVRKNHHPTVKPTELMRYLCRLVTPPGGAVLDPFMGSGSTGKAAVLEGFSFVGVEQSAGYFDIADARILAAENSVREHREATE